MEIKSFLGQSFYGNTLLAYSLAILLFVALYFALKIVRNIVLKRLKVWSQKTETTLDDFIVKAIERSVLPLLNFMSFYISVTNLNLSERLKTVLHAMSVVVLTFFVLRFIISAIRHFIETKLKDLENSDAKLKQIKGIMSIITIIIWVLGIIFLLDNFGYDVTAFVTGLGIGGIAIALAAQNILGDLFNYFVIFFDKPFEVGDFVVVDDKKGTIESVGIKTSRIRSITGEELIISNSDLSNSRVHNFKRMERRRVLFLLGVTYQTSYENLKAIPDMIKEIIVSHQDVQFDRVHFAEYGASSLNFEIVYFYIGTDYVQHMDVRQSINLKIFEEFQKREIYFAYPTQTLFVEGVGK